MKEARKLRLTSAGLAEPRKRGFVLGVVGERGVRWEGEWEEDQERVVWRRAALSESVSSSRYSSMLVSNIWYLE